MKAAMLDTTLGVRAHVHAREIDGTGHTGVRASEPVVSASVFKVPVLIEACERMASGEIDARMRVELNVKDHQVEGPTGLSVFSDPVSLSFRDLCLSMITVSDNRATDVVMEILGIESINRRMISLGLDHTVLERDCHGLFTTVKEDYREFGITVPESLVDDEWTILRTRALDPRRTNRTTPAESTALMSMVWREDGLDPRACGEARRILGAQVWSHRLRRGFPETVKVSGKTGTLPHIRNEIGVVEFPDGRRYAVAVFLRVPSPATVAPRFDDAIAELAREAVMDLR